MHPEHKILLDQLTAAARPYDPARFNPESYFGNDHRFLNVSVPDRRRIARAWVGAHKAWPAQDVLAVVESLLAGETTEEKTIAALLLESCRTARLSARPADVERWLDHLEGWAEVDTLCQNLFPAEQLLADWPAWSALIRRLARDPNVNKRRAALVLLTRPCGRSDDKRLTDLAFETLDALKAERPVIITKAVSWLLRCMAARDPDPVAAYLDRHASSLPAIAVRETRRKIATGCK